jgi:hypothetical protein
VTHDVDPVLVEIEQLDRGDPISTATSDPGTRGAARRMPSTIASETSPTTTVAPLALPSSVTTCQTFWKKSPEPFSTPNRPGSWPAMMTSASPMMKPFSTGSEMKFAMNPSRRRPAARAMMPVEIASAAVNET